MNEELWTVAKNFCWYRAEHRDCTPKEKNCSADICPMAKKIREIIADNEI